MNSEPAVNRPLDMDIGDYCRRVEEHLARANEGHLVRIVGTGFELVRSWALAGIPLSVVCRGIDQKAERHRAGKSRRPLRLEFCEADVRTVHDDWRRAVGVAGYGATPATDESHPAREERRRPSLTRQIDRATDHLVRAAGRLDVPDSLRATLTAVLEQLVVIRGQAAHARGAVRDGYAARLAELDRDLMQATRRAAEHDLPELRKAAAAELAAYRERLTAEDWRRSVDARLDRLLRHRFSLPTLDPETS